jgi:hypothetical protein
MAGKAAYCRSPMWLSREEPLLKRGLLNQAGSLFCTLTAREGWDHYTLEKGRLPSTSQDRKKSPLPLFLLHPEESLAKYSSNRRDDKRLPVFTS